MLEFAALPTNGFRGKYFVAGFTFILFYFGIPFSISDTDNLAFGHTETKFIKSVENLTNENSEIESLRVIDSAMAHFVRQQGIVGSSVGIVKDGQLIYAKGFGHTEQETQQQVQPYHLFRIGSISKLITAVAIMKLQEEGKLKLDDKVFGEEGILKSHLYQNIKDPKAYQITVRHLLDHTAGWSKRTYGDPMFIPHKIAKEMKVPSPASLDAIIKFILSKPIPYRPGTYYDYSNFGYCLLGKVIEELSGMPYEEYVRQDILYPLGITGMRLAKNRIEERMENEVSYYDFSPNNIRMSIYDTGEHVPTTYSFNIEALGAAGGWLATPTDLLKFVVAIDGFKDTPDLLTNESLLAMTHPEQGGRPYGWRGVMADGTWWRTGTLAGTSAILKRLENGISWVVLTNTTNRKSDYFNGRINYVMNKTLSELDNDHWPSHDLFALSYY